MNELKKADEVVRAMRDYASDCDNCCDCFRCDFACVCGKFDYNAPKIIADLIDSLTAQLTESQRREKAAVEAIRKSLRVEKQQRPNLNRCHECAKRIVDSGQRKYKYGCESLCPEALKVIVGCGFDVYEPLIPFADEWRGPQAEKGEADGK